MTGSARQPFECDLAPQARVERQENLSQASLTQTALDAIARRRSGRRMHGISGGTAGVPVAQQPPDAFTHQQDVCSHAARQAELARRLERENVRRVAPVEVNGFRVEGDALEVGAPQGPTPSLKGRPSMRRRGSMGTAAAQRARSAAPQSGRAAVEFVQIVAARVVVFVQVRARERNAGRPKARAVRRRAKRPCGRKCD